MRNRLQLYSNPQNGLRQDMKGISNLLIARRLIDLYVMDVGKKLVQRKSDKGYYTKKDKVRLTDIVNHLEGKQTIGVFSGIRLTKFMTFDVDSGRDGMDRAKQMTWLLLSTLKKKFFINDSELLISFSGHKGYHVDIFFDQAVEKKVVKHFYNKVIEEMNNLLPVSTHDIELRPTGQGVKLPMGIHKQTGKRSYLCNSLLNRVSNKHLFDVYKLSTALWLDKFLNTYPYRKRKTEVFTINPEQAQEVEKMVDGVHSDAKSLSQVMQSIADMIKQGHINFRGTRDQSVFRMAMFMNHQGIDEKAAQAAIRRIMTNSYTNYRELFNSRDSLSFVLKEVDRVTHEVYKNGYQLTGYQTNAKVYKSDIVQILKHVKSMAERKIALAMLIHSRIYADHSGKFFMTYDQIIRLANISTAHKTICKYLNNLESDGIIEIVSRNKVDIIASREASKQSGKETIIKKANVYRVKLRNSHNEPFISITKDGIDHDSLISIIISLIPKSECKQLVTKHQFYHTFNPAY